MTLLSQKGNSLVLYYSLSLSSLLRSFCAFSLYDPAFRFSIVGLHTSRQGYETSAVDLIGNMGRRPRRSYCCCCCCRRCCLLFVVDVFAVGFVAFTKESWPHGLIKKAKRCTNCPLLKEKEKKDLNCARCLRRPGTCMKKGPRPTKGRMILLALTCP